MKVIALVLATLFCLQARSQGLGDWVNQKSEKIENLLIQIAAFKTQVSSVKNGIEIARKGLHAIDIIRQADVEMHGDHFNDLTIIQGSSSNYLKEVDVAMTLSRIAAVVNTLSVESNGVTNKADQQVIQNLVGKARSKVAQLLRDTERALSDKRLKMNPERRIALMRQIGRTANIEFIFLTSLSQNIHAFIKYKTTQTVELKMERIISLE